MKTKLNVCQLLQMILINLDDDPRIEGFDWRQKGYGMCIKDLAMLIGLDPDEFGIDN